MNAQYAIGRGLVVVAALAFGPTGAFAQPPAQSFAALQSTLKAGDTVVVYDDHGVVQGGRVDSIDANQLTIRWPTGFIHRRDRDIRKVYSETSVRRIKKIDSDTNGMLIGGGIGAALVFACVSGSSHDETGGIGCALLVPLGAELGQRIDNAKNRVIYESPQGIVSIRPLLGRRQAALALSFSF